MTKNGHHLTGIGTCIGIVGYTQGILEPHWSILVGILAILGSTAPDWLEIPWYFNPLGLSDNPRKSLIPHRRITHWVLGWVLMLLAGIYGIVQDYTLLGYCVVGFSAGCLTHLLFDIPNPMGVPLFHPWHRTSLKLWKSGQREGLLIIGWLGIMSGAWWM